VTATAPVAPVVATAPAEPVPIPDPAWLREARTSLSVNSQLVLYGNIRDRFLRPADGGWQLPDVLELLWHALARDGYPFLAVVDAVGGVRVLPETAEARRAFKDVTGRDCTDGRPKLPEIAAILESVATAQGRRAAVAVDYASRLTADPTKPEEYDHFFAFAERLSQNADLVAVDGANPLYNPVIWLAQSDRDLPEWVTAGNDSIRKIAVPLPDLGSRLAAAGWLVRALPGYEAAGTEEREQLPHRLAEQTQGLTLTSTLKITRLARRLDLPDASVSRRVEEAVRCYRVGVHDNPWRQADLRARMVGAADAIGQRVSGQSEAIRHSVDIMVRSVLGLSGSHVAGSASRPRGVLFFAGPTGVGKTQLAKELTRRLFGDEQAYIRFDMSEFTAEHAADRLIGAPPGYVGHDAGGELTNAIRERPFSLILFDEIEKAHPRILDKFLQILDDGRLTDASGSTVYFSESVLVFTSNLGISTMDERGTRRTTVTANTPRTELVEGVRRAVRAHFVEQLNRPELLNRFGDNIVVFNFIDRAAARSIFDGLVEQIAGRVHREQRLTLVLSRRARDELLAAATDDLGNGGRGIGSVLESALVNPLARELFERGLPPGAVVTVESVSHRDGSWQVELSC
jgi:ATP-dependent Clp protease ATP-binding subunit ClpB